MSSRAHGARETAALASLAAGDIESGLGERLVGVTQVLRRPVEPTPPRKRHFAPERDKSLRCSEMSRWAQQATSLDRGSPVFSPWGRNRRGRGRGPCGMLALQFGELPASTSPNTLGEQGSLRCPATVPSFAIAVSRDRFALDHVIVAVGHSGPPSEKLPQQRLRNRASDTTRAPYRFLSRRSTPLRLLAPYRRQGQSRD